MNTYKNTTQNVQPGIYLETKPVVDTFKSSSKRILPKFFENSHHAYLRYVRSDGKELIIRGGPKNNQQINGIGLGKIYMQTNKPFKQSYDYYSPGTESYKRFSHKLDIDEKKLDEIWNEMSKVSNKINQGQYPYDNIPQQQNSNSVIRTILDETKFDGIKQMPDFMLKHLPGYDKNLFSLPTIEIDKKEATELKRA